MAKKWVNGDDKNLRHEYVNHEIYDKLAYLLKNMILVCAYVRFRQLLNMVGRKLLFFKHSANLIGSAFSA